MPKFLLVLFVSFFLTPSIVSANVLINEITWMGTEKSYNDEWLELSNQTDSVVSLEGWRLKAADGTPEITLSGSIAALGFYLLERTNDDVIPDVLANQIYTGALSNNGEKLELYDNLGNLIDFVDCSSGWIAGDNQTKQTMERTDSGNWQNSQDPGGTPAAKNSSFLASSIPPLSPLSPLSPSFSSPAGLEKEGESLPESQTSAGSPENQTYPAGIIINEILASPEGPDNEEEWIELKNLNNQMIDVSGWKIQDAIGSTKTYIFPENSKIFGQGFLLLERLVSKITLNNSGDGLKLFYPNDEIADELNYEKTPLGQSCNRQNNICTWSSILTPGLENITNNSNSEPISSLIQNSAEEKKPSSVFNKNSETEKQLAAVSSQIQKPQSPVFAAILLAIFSAIIILILKKKLKKIVEV